MSDDPKKTTSELSLPVGWISQIVVFRRASVWQPATDAYETPDGLTVMVEVAGMKAGEVSVTLDGRRLIIAGKRNRPAAQENAVAYHQLEIQYGEFRTEIVAPWPVSQEGIKATYEDGFLRVTLPRLRQSHTVQVIDVKQDEIES